MVSQNLLTLILRFVQFAFLFDSRLYCYGFRWSWFDNFEIQFRKTKHQQRNDQNKKKFAPILKQMIKPLVHPFELSARQRLNGRQTVVF